MKIYSICIILVFLISLPTKLNAFSSDSIDYDVKQLIKQYQIPALSIAVIDNKNILYQKNFGYISLSSNHKVNNQTIWQIASISKTFLAATLAILNDRKIISWDDKVIDHINYFRLKNPNFTRNITIGDIASMQSGLPPAAGKEYLKNAKDNPDIIKNLSLIDSVASPGSGYFSYQYSLLSVIEELISTKTGINWKIFIKNELFKKLNLKNTGIDIYKLADKRNVARPVSNLNEEIEWENFKVNSAAGFYSSLDDMVKWLQFSMNEGIINKKRLISLAQNKKIHHTYTKITNNEAYLNFDNNIIVAGYGYFWKNLTYKFDNSEITVYEHNGNCEGMSSIISYIPKENIGIIISSNKLTPVPEIIRSKLIELTAKHHEN